MKKRRLAKADWIEAGFNALANSGYAAIKVEAIARNLKTTKGSFYWHFKDLRAFKLEMLERWRLTATETVIEALDEAEPGEKRLVALIGMATSPARRSDTAQTELAIREWARHDHDAAKCVSAVDLRRIEFLQAELKHLGNPDKRHAHLLYATYLGLRTLTSTTEIDGDDEFELMFGLLSVD